MYWTSFTVDFMLVYTIHPYLGTIDDTFSFARGNSRHVTTVTASIIKDGSLCYNISVVDMMHIIGQYQNLIAPATIVLNQVQAYLAPGEILLHHIIELKLSQHLFPTKSD